MERITMSIDETLAKEIDAHIGKRGYGSRSEAMRDLLRRELDADRIKHEARAACVASLSYVFNHHVRDLAGRLTSAQHAHHDLVVATMHVHLDHEDCLESSYSRERRPPCKRSPTAFAPNEESFTARSI
jgi:CopG family transcriptional regulator, nickel-responsive regulator